MVLQRGCQAPPVQTKRHRQLEMETSRRIGGVPVAATADVSLYRGYRYPADIITHAVWLYYRFSLSLRDVEELMAERE